jgi:hypothetical protein
MFSLPCTPRIEDRVKRLHLFELMDLSFCPEWLRRMETEYIQAAEDLFETTAPIVERVAQALARTGLLQIVDLCSGAGGPMLQLLDQLWAGGTRATAVLTDLHPQVEGWKALSARSNGRLSYIEPPVDATQVPKGLVGMRTIFDGLHHLKPAQVRAVLDDTVRAGLPFLALETTQRSWKSLASIALVPAAVWAITPLIRPVSLRRIAATYALPIVPVAMAWDGAVSTLRTYRPAELRQFAEGLLAPGWTWDIGTQVHNHIPISWMLGTPP